MTARMVVLVLAALGAAATAQVVTDAESPPRILVGPDMLVSRDGDFPHVELILAANPKDASNLVGGAITYTQPQGGMACRAYASVDGGTTWTPSEFPEQVQFGGADPYVAFTPHGTAIFSALSMRKDENDRTRAFLDVWRSEDGGRSWGPTIELGYSYDHEQIAVDHTTGRHAGNIYIGVLYGYPEYTVGVFRSEDDGRTWTGPVKAASGGGTKGINVVQPMVLSDGALVVPYVDFEFLPDRRPSTGQHTNSAWMVISRDGGVSFGEPIRMQTLHFDLDDKVAGGLGGFPAFAADAHSAPFRDRLYMAWPDHRAGTLRVLFSRSEDRGATWSEPISIGGDVPAGTLQYQPVLAVNADGVLGLSWYDSRDGSDPGRYHQYFSASVDGGVTFLPPVRVSSAPSTPMGQGNMRFGAMTMEYKDASYLNLISAASRWRNGGDYMGLAADRKGLFHPFWADARSGTFQIYTAAVAVQSALAGGAAAAGPAPAPPAAWAAGALDDLVQVVFDPTRYDGDLREAEIPMRLVNLSSAPIRPPITVEILGFGIDDPELPDESYGRVTILNAANGGTGVGARFDFSGALGNLESLAPGAQTGPVVLRLRLEDPTNVPPIRWRLEGMLPQRRQP